MYNDETFKLISRMKNFFRRIKYARKIKQIFEDYFKCNYRKWKQNILT